MTRNKRFRWWVGFLMVFLVCLGVYTTTVARRVTGYGDSDELLTTGYLWGVPHPPGYPLLNALVWGATHVPVPSTTLSQRGHLVSALLQALTVGLVYLSGLALVRKNKLAVASGALMLGFSFLFWLYANTLEVVALNAFLTMMVVWLTLKKRTVWLGVLTGMMLAHHQTSVVLLPGLFVWWSGVFSTKREWVFFFLTLILGFTASYALLFSFDRAAFVSWTFSPTLAGWWHHFSRSDFGGNLEGGQVQAAFWSGVDVYTAWRSLAHYITVSLPSQWGWWLVVIVWGAIQSWRRLPRRMVVGLLVMLAGSLMLVAYLAIPDKSMGGADYYLTRALTERMYVVGYVLLGLFGIVGLTSVRVPRILLLVLPVIMVASNYRGVDLSGYDVVDRLAHAQLAVVPDDSLIVCGSDMSCFSLLYLQGVERERLNITVLPVPPQLRDTHLQITTRNPFRIVDAVGEQLAGGKNVFFAEVGYPYAQTPWLFVEVGRGVSARVPLGVEIPKSIDERNSYQMWLAEVLTGSQSFRNPQ